MCYTSFYTSRFDAQPLRREEAALSPQQKRLAIRTVGLIVLTAGLALHPGPVCGQSEAIGDTITVIQRPLLNIPVIITPAQIFQIECAADPATTGWAAELRHGQAQVELEITGASYDPQTSWWTLTARPIDLLLYELYDLRVTASGGIEDVTWNAVQVIPAFRSSWYFVQLTDPHLPDALFSDSGGTPADSSEMDDMRAVIDDLNLIRPEFVLLTGDLINEGELEDYQDWRSYTRAQRLLRELEVPVYLVAGNHDLGGWDATPPPDGTARRNWWRFFGWRRLDDPPTGAPERTQNFSFDYGPVHFVGLEAYINYDGWRYSTYGGESFTDAQLDWLQADLAAASGSGSQVLFYHYDFKDQIDLNGLGAEMALSGHIHRDQGSLASTPYDLTTNNVCDGERSYRLVRVSGSTLAPKPTLAAGASGSNLRVTWSPANDGSADIVTAQVINTLGESFQHLTLKVLMPAGTSAVQVTGGTLLQVDDAEPLPVFYIEVNVPASSSRTVIVEVDDTTGTGDHAALSRKPHLGRARPNPFNPATEMRFSLPRAGSVQVAVYDARGRMVAVLAEGEWPAGEHLLRWNGQDLQGQVLPSGIYFVRLAAGDTSMTQKVILAK
jgi:3',5'-cyclic AMP phosphodiesterase CpdA